MSVTPFGFNDKNEPVSLYTVENEFLSLSVTDYGATMVSIVDKATDTDILLGYDSIEGYIKNDGHIGGFIGRTANRIKNGTFELNGKLHQLEVGIRGNNIHGGSIGFDRVMYDTRIEGNSIICHRVSKDGEMGYPGDLDVTVTYTLDERTVEMKAEGKALDQDTIFGMTNHNYYNMDGSSDILNHRVTIYADQYAIDNEEGISQMPLRPVENTAFDFRKEKTLGQDINDPDPQIQNNKGYDHHWAVPGEGVRPFASCKGEKLELLVESNLPGMHVYTANFLKGAVGKKGIVHVPHLAVCFEPEYFPNGINTEGVEKLPIVRKGETSVQIIRMTVRPL
ncbi:MAG: galactose mutarotase [Parasporobacterium sp.]|nr:galactose mutarotase [Parasporobacterium sp.]